MGKKFLMSKVSDADAATVLEEATLRQLNLHQHDADLAREQYAHALTRMQMVKFAAEAAALKAELSAIDARKKADAAVVETRTEFSAAQERLEKLTANIRREHNLTDKHAIDAQTGAVLMPEG